LVNEIISYHRTTYSLGGIMANPKKTGTARHLGGRLKEWRKLIPLKGFELAELIAISQGSLSDIENNKSLPSCDTIAKLYKYTNINIIWLMIGKGPMTKTQSQKDYTLAEVVTEDLELDKLGEQMIRVYCSGNVKNKAHLKGFLEGADPGK